MNLLAVAVSCWKTAAGSTELAAAERDRLIAQGIEATNQALVLDKDCLDALTCKTLLLRLQASLETDAATHASLLEQADDLRNQATALAKQHHGR